MIVHSVGQWHWMNSCRNSSEKKSISWKILVLAVMIVNHGENCKNVTFKYHLVRAGEDSLCLEACHACPKYYLSSRTSISCRRVVPTYLVMCVQIVYIFRCNLKIQNRPKIKRQWPNQTHKNASDVVWTLQMAGRRPSTFKNVPLCCRRRINTCVIYVTSITTLRARQCRVCHAKIMKNALYITIVHLHKCHINTKRLTMCTYVSTM
jgi:hypothetical protein